MRRESFRLVVLGLVVGLAVAYCVRRFVESTFFGLSAGDPLTHVVSRVRVTLVASLRSRARGARVDPMSLRAPIRRSIFMSSRGADEPVAENVQGGEPFP